MGRRRDRFSAAPGSASFSRLYKSSPPAMSLYQRLLGIPFVYDRVRPFVVGGIDMSPLFRNLQARRDDVILDVGCGTGMALDYLDGFAAYHGFDTDEVAIGFAR